MPAQYIIRLDDASEYMDYAKWTSYFELFDQYKIIPIIAVIPFNKDPKMLNNTPDNGFWDKVRDWHGKGYRIAMHGFEHVYVTNCSGLVGINKRSEFAGIPFEKQVEMLSKSYRKFIDEKIIPEIFVAPAHSFDRNTIRALKKATSIRYISDGHFLHVIRKDGLNWIPQQLWAPEEKTKGVWTFCIHPETSNIRHYEEVSTFVQKHSKDFTDPLSLNVLAMGALDWIYFEQKRIKIKLKDLFVKYCRTG